MLESANIRKEPLPVGADHMSLRMHLMVMSKPVSPLVDGLLKFKSKDDLGGFHNEVRLDRSKEIGACRISNGPTEQRSMCRLHAGRAAEATAELIVKSLDDGPMGHVDPADEIVPDMRASGLLPAPDTDIPVAIEKACHITNIKHGFAPREADEKLANSGNIRCPARKGAEGQSRAKQRHPTPASGVCREHVPTPKGKMCSELYGNIERPAEMTGRLHVTQCDGLHEELTDCNTNYIFWRPHEERNMVPLNPDRFAVNQDAMVKLIGFAGNMTMSNRFLQGVITA